MMGLEFSIICLNLNNMINQAILFVICVADYVSGRSRLAFLRIGKQKNTTPLCRHRLVPYYRHSTTVNTAFVAPLTNQQFCNHHPTSADIQIRNLLLVRSFLPIHQI